MRTWPCVNCGTKQYKEDMLIVRSRDNQKDVDVCADCIDQDCFICEGCGDTFYKENNDELCERCEKYQNEIDTKAICRQIREVVKFWTNMEVDDICQQAWLTILRYTRRHKKSPTDKLITVIAKHTSWQWYKRNVIREEREEFIANDLLITNEENSVSRRSESAEIFERYKKEMMRMKPIDKIVWNNMLEGYNCRENSYETNLEQEEIKAIIARVRYKLREKLKQFAKIV